MSGLCGWIGARSDRIGSQSALARMIDGLPCHGRTAQNSAAAETAGLALRSDPVTGSWHAGADLLAAIEGYPVWSDHRLAAAATAHGHAKALAQGYRDRGETVLDVLHGAFSLAVLEPSAGRGLLAIDRIGIQSLCHAQAADGSLLFGSTTEAIARHGALTAAVSAQAIFDYFYFVDRIPAPETIYNGIAKLAPGHRVLFEAGRAEAAPYWHMPYDGQRVRADEAQARLLPELRAAMMRCMEAEDPAHVGAFLSGGLDSTTVAGLLAERAPRPKVFTIGFSEPGYDETPYARVSAEHFDCDHRVYYIRPEDVFEAVPKIAAIYDEPFGNSSAVPAYLCARVAREAGVETMLAGDGGDEIFAGNAHYLKDYVFDRYRLVPRLLRRGLIEPALESLSGMESLSLVRRARSYVRQAQQGVAERMCRDNLYLYFAPSDVFSGEFLAAVSPHAPLDLINRIYRSARTDDKIQRMMHLDLRITLADSDLRKVSRTCELAGVRVRYPLLDHEVVSYAASIDPGVLLAGGTLRSFYKRALADFLPGEVLTKEKKGFGLPYLQMLWTFDPLRELALDNLQALRKQDIFSGRFLAEASRSLQKREEMRFGAVIWDLMTLNLWFENRPASVTA